MAVRSDEFATYVDRVKAQVNSKGKASAIQELKLIAEQHQGEERAALLALIPQVEARES